jgi:hypothetical protein
MFESNDVRNIGFIIRKDINRVDREIFKKELFAKLTKFACSAEDEQRLNDACAYLPFSSCIPNFQIRLSKNISVGSSAGRVSTSALMIHCDSLHVNFMNKFLTRYYEKSNTDEKFVPHSMLNGKDAAYLKAYRNAIVFHNQFLSASRVLPVIGLHPKAMSALIQLGEDEPADVLTYIK